jgi:hypothetical protein
MDEPQILHFASATISLSRRVISVQRRWLMQELEDLEYGRG